ncbi:MAG: hypothetical protein IPH44_13710 [Myxococcales bacterium]|nr:hypothetical protein [Myxococcales bacterium]MBP6847210.1 hypothetical protein [Kofleriaceae bacterium]
MRHHALLALAALAGCNQVLGLDPVAGRDATTTADDAGDGAADGGPTDANAPDARCPGATPRTFTPIADTTIIANDTQAHGDISVMNVSAQLASQALVLFDVTTLPATETVVAARLILPFPAKATACGGECGDCAPLETTGNLTIQYLRPDWSETATWVARSGTAPWSSPGASTFDVDRSAVTAAIPHTAAAATIAELPPALLGAWATWRRNDRLAFVLAPAGGRAIIPTREYQSLETCDASLGQPTLVVESCP